MKANKGSQNLTAFLMNNYYDTVIIGAGAAGLMCAMSAAKRNRKVLLIDHHKKVGEKIRISGGGRCNFTNIHTTAKNFISQNPHFCVSALQRFTQNDFIDLVKKHKIAFHEKTLGQLFCDASSQQIIDMLVSECQEFGVEIMLETKVENIEKLSGEDSGARFCLEINKTEIAKISCESLVIATGGLSIPKMGATGFGYDVARKFNLNIIEPYPALVPLTLESSMLEDTKHLAGVSVDAVVSCKSLKNIISFKEAILFTHRGLSGPAILQISSYIKNGQEIFINLAPNHNFYEIFLSEKQEKPRQEIAQIIAKYLPKSLAAYISYKHNIQGFVADLSNQKLKEIASDINNWRVIVQGNEGYAKAEVTAGGVDTNEISSKTFESKKVSGLYFIGEVLDVTGHLGGFNFQFAWSCGFACGQFA